MAKTHGRNPGKGPRSTRDRTNGGRTSERAYRRSPDDRSFIDLVRKLLAPDGALSRLYSEMVEAGLKSPRVFRESYLRNIAGYEKQESAEEKEKLLIRALMNAYLETLRSREDHSTSLIDLHKRMIDAYLELAEDLGQELERAREDAVDVLSAFQGRGTEPENSG